MADLDKIKVRKTDTLYNIADTPAREAINAIAAVIPAGASSQNKLVDNTSFTEGLAGKADASDVPTKTSELTNDSGFITNTVDNLLNYYTKSQTYTQTEVDALIAAVKNGRFISVATLPTTDIDTKAIYLVPSADPEAGNVKDEYINLDGTSSGWELIGSTAIDLSGYVTDEELTAALADYVTNAGLAAILADYATTSAMNTAIQSEAQRASGAESALAGRLTTAEGNIQSLGTAVNGKMSTATYDSNGNGIVDNAEKVNNHTVDKDVPSNAVFTDTVYDDTELRNKIGNLANLDTEDTSNLVAAVNELVSDFAGVDEEVEKLEAFSGSQTLLDSEGNEILDSSNNRILDTEYGAAGVVTTLSNIVSWFKNNLSHLIQDSGYTQTKELYEILNS